MSYKVIIIQKRLPHYRKPFFELLKESLAQREVELVLIYGNQSQGQISRQDQVELEWAHQVDNREIRIANYGSLIWQPCLRHVWGADLVIVEQASKLLINYLLFILSKIGLFKLSFWGHGISFLKSDEASFGEKVKRTLSKRVDWWFAYNDKSASIVESFGFPPNKTTSVKNTIETKELVYHYNNIDDRQINNAKAQYGIHSENVALFLGSLYAERGIDFLITACQIIRQLKPDFEIIVIGAGGEVDKVERLAAENDWVHYFGPVFEPEKKALFFKMTKIMLLPGPVGLVVIESFATATPLITLELSTHGPEIDYIVNDFNGVIVPAPQDSVLYAKEVVKCMNDITTLQRLQSGCQHSYKEYSMEAMVQQFTTGVLQAIRK